jgi:hypothetical protein
VLTDEMLTQQLSVMSKKLCEAESQLRRRETDNMQAQAADFSKEREQLKKELGEANGYLGMTWPLSGLASLGCRLRSRAVCTRVERFSTQGAID